MRIPVAGSLALTRVAARRHLNGDGAVTSGNDGVLLLRLMLGMRALTQWRSRRLDGLALSRLMSGVPDKALLNAIALPAGATFTTGSTICSNINTRCGTSY